MNKRTRALGRQGRKRQFASATARSFMRKYLVDYPGATVTYTVEACRRGNPWITMMVRTK